MAPPEYWKEAQELCREHRTLLVIDEVQTGLGRTGKFLCFEHWDLEPDIITVSKALSEATSRSGAVLTSEPCSRRVFSSIEKAFKHSTTFGRNQLAMVAGLATLATFDDENIIERARRAGEAFHSALAPLVENYEMFHEVRGKGLMIGLQFGPPQSKACAGASTGSSSPTAIFQMMVVPLFHRHRILTQVAADNVNIIKLLPPLICGQEEIDYFVAALDDVLKDAHSGSGLMWEFGRTMAAGALRRTGRARPDLPMRRRPRPKMGAAQAMDMPPTPRDPHGTVSYVIATARRGPVFLWPSTLPFSAIHDRSWPMLPPGTFARWARHRKACSNWQTVLGNWAKVACRDHHEALNASS